ncbi:hypothetical protein DVA86_24820 [Streptomyces armeniacus]|uniref:PH domain-containing protein n=1 Tax=Streptomyces armeniacus TaxID=83291 RepID=A0A345XUS3_9ACTN|nr:hypothetical protein [Streptomyces armeniacus]AXK35389.1 hypothetical protein DVA86_24820 [Streptomyces armeniacus]
MPLTILTADRELDDDASALAGEAPPPFEERDEWRRPYRPGPWRVAGGALLLLLASYLLISTVIIAFAGALPGAAVCAAAAAAVIALALRLLRVGVWVSAHGLRQVGIFYTVTLEWREVAAVRTAQQPVRWLGLPRTVQGQALVVVRAAGAGGAHQVPQGAAAYGQGAEGEPLRTLLTDHNADFLNRTESFDRAADVIEAWADESRGVAAAPARPRP